MLQCEEKNVSLNAASTHYMISDKKDFGTIRIPQALINELKVWRQAFINVDNRPITYECILSNMLGKLESERPDVYKEVRRIKDSKK